MKKTVKTPKGSRKQRNTAIPAVPVVLSEPTRIIPEPVLTESNAFAPAAPVEALTPPIKTTEAKPATPKRPKVDWAVGKRFKPEELLQWLRDYARQQPAGSHWKGLDGFDDAAIIKAAGKSRTRGGFWGMTEANLQLKYPARQPAV